MGFFAAHPTRHPVNCPDINSLTPYLADFATNSTDVTIPAAVVILALAVFQVVRKTGIKRSPLDALPSVGIPRYPCGFYVGAWNYLKHGRAITQDGYIKHRGKPFKVALANRWLVLVSGRQLVEDLRKASDEFLSFSEGINSVLHHEYTVGHEQHHDPYQIPVVRSPMTRNIAVCFPDLYSEVVAAFENLVPATTDDWISVCAMQTMLPVVSRVSNRFFVGLKCRDPEYIKITTQFASDVIRDAAWLHVTPPFLRPLAARLFGHLESATRRAMKHLGPIIQHRLNMDERYGRDWPNTARPNDMISWLVDEVRGHQTRRTVRTLTRTLLNVNFGAIHTTTEGCLHALYSLAANPNYIEPLRTEISSIVQTEGWTKVAIGKMVMLDSFMKESSRFSPGGAVGMLRHAVKDFTFSDGTVVPAGTLIAVPILAEHHDERNYPNAQIFDPFRFSRMRDVAGEGLKHQMVTPSPSFLTFGLGRHACPGRFFAVNEQKLIMAHVILTYDFRLEDGLRPEDEWLGLMQGANTSAKVLFRRRKYITDA
ncbi:cytochrome P450 [Mycena alexandri]|uniref:Cytochrome P450 n=1 Tax=Mycena alexandri TaxID=1745969 RepID=A0AAD6WP36_9AGAR|nr:cytochrome P450 [Mycena alexandri]